MKQYLKKLFCVVLIVPFFTGCSNYRKLVNDEVVFTDGSSQTGTIIQCDSVNLKIKRMDESINILPWKIIDTVQGKKLRTFWLGANIGYYKAPYFSVFRNESFAAERLGIEWKVGIARRGNKLYYLDFLPLNDKPYAVTKIGLGYQQYICSSTYLKTNSFFVGSEFNLMNVERNNGPQITIEPFGGFERKYNEHFRFNCKLGLQFNLANKNNRAGVNLTIGVHYMKRNFKKYYDTLNKEHRIPGK